MPKTTHKHARKALIGLALFISFVGKAQETRLSTSYLIPYIQQLENTFSVKFSYVDKDIDAIEIKVPNTEILNEILDSIRNQTQLRIQKLNDRYYTIVKSDTVTICGIVFDNFKENRLSGATITVLGTDITAVTDFDGAFSLDNVPRNSNIQIRHLGYKTLYIKANELVSQNPCKSILLDDFYQELDEVIVYQFLTTGLAKQLDASIELTPEEFGILPGLSEPDVLQTVQALPGIKSIDETVSDINIRGGSNDQNLLLWDGIKMYQSGHFFGLISAFNPYLIDKVNISKNGTSAKYGDGVSGVIDIQTKNELTDTFFGGVGFNLISGDIYGQLPLTNTSAFQFSAKRSVTDFLNTPTFDQFFERSFQENQVNRNSKFFFYDFTAKLLYDINPRQKIRLSFININNALDNVERSSITNEETQSVFDQGNLSFGGSLTSNWNEKLSSFLNAYYTSYNLDSKNVSGNQVQILFQNNKVIEKAIKFNTNWKFNDTFDWMNGYNLIETGITNITEVTEPLFESRIKQIVRTHAVFSEVAYQSPNEKLYTKGGVRLNYLDNPGTFEELIIEPRLAVNYEIAQGLKAIFLGEFKSQATNQIIDLEQNFLGIEKRRWAISDNIDLPITKSKQASIGLNYEQQNLYIGLEGFYKEVDGISATTQGFQNQNQFEKEIGKYNIKGIEFLINKKTNDYSIWASYAYNFNNYTFFDFVPPNFPNNLDIRHNATFAGTYTYNNLKIGAGLNYRTGKSYTEPLADDPIDTTSFPNIINYEEPNSSRLPDYIRADASVIYSFDISHGIKASVGASVLNIMNRKNILNRFYELNEANEIELIESKSLGLTPNFSFRMTF